MDENSNPADAPFSDLTPDCVIDALCSIGLPCDGRLLALNSYENRVYQVGMEDSAPLVAKFYRPARWTDAAILEEHAFVSELAAHEIPVVPALLVATKTLHPFRQYRFSVFPRQGGRAPELDQPDTLRWMGRFLGRIHAIGARCSFQARPTLDVTTFGEMPRDYLLQQHWIPAELLSAWQSVVQQALDSVRQCYLRAGNITPLRLHGDCHAGNVLWTDSGPHFVDFDDARTGPAIQDLWMLLSGDPTEMTRQLNAVLEGYQDFFDFNPAELHLIEALRTLRLLHYAAWIAQRWNDPAFPLAFPWFNTPRYWQDRILELREQIALMSEPPLRIF